MGFLGLFGDDEEQQAEQQQPIDPTVENYIKQKYKLDQEYEKAKGDASSGNRNAGIIEGLSTMFSGGKTDSGFYQNLKNRNDTKIAQADANRKNLASEFGQMRQMKDWESKDADSAEERDPNSMRSQIARSTATKFGGDKIIPADKLAGMSAAEINKYLPFMKDAYNADLEAANRKASQDAIIAQRKADQANKDREFGLKEKELALKSAKQPADIKSDNEVAYRYNSLKQKAADLKALVQKHGTNVMTGPEGTEMDRAIYQMAVDYAKLVDPDSVAREGEVAAAQKYMLPFREYGGLTTSNDTAVSQIDGYVADLDKRLAAKEAATGRSIAGADKTPWQPSPGSGTAIAAPPPKEGTVDGGYRFKGGNPADPNSWEKVQ
jgi:hypothetical protein